MTDHLRGIPWADKQRGSSKLDSAITIRVDPNPQRRGMYRTALHNVTVK